MKNLVRFTYYDSEGKEYALNADAQNINHDFKQSLYSLLGALCRTIKKYTGKNISLKHERYGSKEFDIKIDSIGCKIYINGFLTEAEENQARKELL